MTQFNWIEKRGKDSEDHRFEAHVMIDGSGRIAAKVFAPLADEYAHRLYLYMTADEDKIERHFIDLDAAKRFAQNKAERLWERFTAQDA